MPFLKKALGLAQELTVNSSTHSGAEHPANPHGVLGAAPHPTAAEHPANPHGVLGAAAVALGKSATPTPEQQMMIKATEIDRNYKADVMGGCWTHNKLYDTSLGELANYELNLRRVCQDPVLRQ